MKALLTVTSLKTAYGGPAVSVSSLANALSREGVQVGLWSRDDTNRQEVSTCSSSPRRLYGNIDDAIAQFGCPDIIHDNGIWLPHNHRIASLARRENVARIVSPRGMLAPWARRHKSLKKSAAWHLYQRKDLENASALHATSQDEQADLSALRLAPIREIPNGLCIEDEVGESRRREARDTKEALFLGRIYPVKGLANLIAAWRRTRPSNWRLTIVGPDESGHRAELQRMVHEANLSDVVKFEGPLAGEAKHERLRSADLFVLPSLSESFGMAVAEALAAATPVLTTTATPWRSIEKEGLGWWVDPNVASLSDALAEASSASQDSLSEMGNRGRTFVRETFAWDRLVARYLDLYHSCIANSRDSGLR